MNKDQVTEISANGAVVSATTIIDTQGYQSLTFIASVVNGTTFALKHGEDSGLSDEETVPAAFIVGDVAYTAGGTGKVGYVGKKRYVEITVGTPATDVTITAIQGYPLKAPTPAV